MKTEAQKQATRKWRASHPETNRRYSREHYALHAEEKKAHQREVRQAGSYKEYRALRRVARIEFIRSQKLGKVCATCGESDAAKLVFHHVDPATKRLAVSSMREFSESAILEEIAKCVLWCIPCHMRHHKTLPA